MIGEEDEHTKVTKFWSGLQYEIQRDLWRNKLNPEVSSLKEVVAAAEIVEIARSVVTWDRDRGTRRAERPIRSFTNQNNAPATRDDDSDHGNQRSRPRRRKSRDRCRRDHPSDQRTTKEEALSHDKRIRNLQSLNLPRKTRKDTSPKDCVSCAINLGISRGIVPPGTKSHRAVGINSWACQVSVLISTLATWRCSASCRGTLHPTYN